MREHPPNCMNRWGALIEDTDSNLRWDGHKVTEEWWRDLSQLKDLYRRLHTHINKQDVQHSAAMKVGDLRMKLFYFLDGKSQQNNQNSSHPIFLNNFNKLEYSPRFISKLQ